jgi:excisionase family DNA binding protein
MRRSNRICVYTRSCDQRQTYSFEAGMFSGLIVERSMNQLMSIPQFAELLGVTPSCIRRMVLERRLSVVKVGRLVRIPAAEFDRIVAEGTRPARQAGEEKSSWQR